MPFINDTLTQETDSMVRNSHLQLTCPKCHTTGLGWSLNQAGSHANGNVERRYKCKASSCHTTISVNTMLKLLNPNEPKEKNLKNQKQKSINSYLNPKQSQTTSDINLSSQTSTSSTTDPNIPTPSTTPNTSQGSKHPNPNDETPPRPKKRLSIDQTHIQDLPQTKHPPNNVPNFEPNTQEPSPSPSPSRPNITYEESISSQAANSIFQDLPLLPKTKLPPTLIPCTTLPNNLPPPINLTKTEENLNQIIQISHNTLPLKMLYVNNIKSGTSTRQILENFALMNITLDEIRFLSRVSSKTYEILTTVRYSGHLSNLLTKHKFHIIPNYELDINANSSQLKSNTLRIQRNINLLNRNDVIIPFKNETLTWYNSWNQLRAQQQSNSTPSQQNESSNSTS